VASLLVICGPDQGKRFDVQGESLRIGRDRSNNVQLRDTEVSRQHAELRRQGNGEYWLIDLGSSNGTFVNGQRVQQCQLQTGDRIQVGKSILVFHTGDTVVGEGLAQRVDMVRGESPAEASGIVRTLSQEHGSQFLLHPERVDEPWIRAALAHLAILYQASQVVSHVGDIRELLKRVLELSFQSIPAERGCILLQDEETGEYVPVAVHWREGVNPDANIRISRTIIDHVLTHREGLLTSDAASDSRLQAGMSIREYAIREAICVPMEGRHGLVGVLYLDRRAPLEEILRQRTLVTSFTEDQLRLALTIGRIAALAVEDTKYYQALVRSERLAAVGQAMAALSHHIKNILQGLKGGGHLIELGLKQHNEDYVRQGWTIVHKNQNRMYHLVMDMLSYSKDRVPALERASVNDIVREVVELTEPAAREGNIEVHLDLDPSNPVVELDPEGMHQAVLNLVLNAIDALRWAEGGWVRVSTRLDRSTGTLIITVQDNGPGIPRELHEQIFQPFFSTKGSRGTGLGLAVTEKIVKEHGGRVVLESEVGQGARFEIHLPVLSPASEPSH
jgi:signal transduction histidine kinase